MLTAFAPDHRRADLLRHAGLTIGYSEDLPDELFTPDAVTFCISKMKGVRPVQKWLVDHVSR